MGVVLKSIKYKGKYYLKGNSIKVDTEDIEKLINKGYIEYSPIKEVEEMVEVDVRHYGNVTISTLTTIADIKKALDEKGIKYKSNARKDELIDLLEGGNID